MSKNKVPNKANKGIVSNSKAKTSSPILPRTDNFNLVLEKYAFAITTSLLLLVAFAVFQDFIFFKKLFLYKDIGSDTLNLAYPSLKHLADYIHTLGLPKWSFNAGMGQNIFPFCLQRDPFDIILYIIGKDNIAYFIAYIEFIKVITAGILFFLYLRTLSLNAFTCMVGSLLFAFSGFMILGGGWFIFSFEAVAAALLLLAFEKLFKQNSWILFPIAIALIAISMPFNLYIYGLFLTIYAIFRFFDEKKWNFKEFVFLFLKMIALGLLGLAMSSFFMLSNVLQLLESPRVAGDVSYFNALSSQPIFSFGTASQNITSVLRLFSSDAMGTGTNFKGWNNYLEAPMFYCGLLSLLLFPLVFQFLNKKRKIIYGLFLAFWILPVVFPYFRYAFWLFTGDYYRGFSFIVSFTLLFLALQALNRINEATKIKPLILIISLPALLGILFYNFSDLAGLSNDSFNKDVLFFAKIFLVLYAIYIYLLTNPNYKTAAKIFLIITLCVELGYSSNITVNNRAIVSKEEFKRKEGYNDYSVEAIAYIKQHDKGFYRIGKNYCSGPTIHSSFNDGMAQDYFGTSSYNSFNQMYYILFMQAIGFIKKGDEIGSRFVPPLAERPLVEDICSIKYFLGKPPYLTFIFDSIARFEDVNIYRNNYFLPLGFTYDKFVLRSEFDGMSQPQKDVMMLKAFFIDNREKDIYKEFNMLAQKDTAPDYGTDDFKKDYQLLKTDTLAISNFGQNAIKGTIKLDKKKLLFLSIPYDKGWTAKVNGVKQEIKIVDAGMSALLLDKGNYTIELEFFPRLVHGGSIISIIALLLFAILIYITKKNQAA